MKLVTVTSYKNATSAIEQALENFQHSGTVLYQGRNVVKILQVGKERMNIKRFRKPNLLNQFVYRFLRKSKAHRSFEYAQRLQENGVGTPYPVAYCEQFTTLGLSYSYYFSQQVDCDFTFRALIHDDTIENREEILKQYVAFVFHMHEKGIYFLDNSPGNTLITKVGDNYQFALVDLNRMKFYDIPYVERLQNFERLAPVKWMYEIMGAEYARLSGTNAQEAIDQMWQFTEQFQYKWHRKERRKKAIKAWKNKLGM
ncbi:MAG: Kdo domain containing protein [Nonlabens sp.]|nr:Kdo domain containing protein [Nonlabens sp.]